MEAYAYVRYSTARQSTGDSVERQKSPLSRFEDRYGVRIKETFVDAGVSSFRGDNIKKGQFRSLLDKIENKEIVAGDFIVLESIDRVSRQELNKTASQLYAILEKGIKIYTTNDEKLYSLEDKSRDLENYLMIGLIAKRANEESETKSKRRKSAWRKVHNEAKESGKAFSNSRVHYGYKLVDGKYQIVEDEAEEIRQLFDLIINEGVYNAVAEVNKTAKRKWTASNVYKLMRSKAVVGYLRRQETVDGKREFREYIPDFYPAIIDEFTFRRAEQAIARRKTNKVSGRNTEAYTNIFRHTAYCDKCGSKMIYTKKQKASGKYKYYYLFCNEGKEKGTGCRNTIDYAYVLHKFCEKIFLATAFNAEDIPSHASLINALAKLLSNKKDIEKAKQQRELENKLAKEEMTEANLQRMIDNLEEIPPNYVLKKLSNTEKEIEGLKTKLTLIEEQVGLEMDSLSDFMTMLRSKKGRADINNFLIANNITFSLTSEKVDTVAREYSDPATQKLFYKLEGKRAKKTEITMKITIEGETFVDNFYKEDIDLDEYALADMSQLEKI
ncbi:recombinase family protein [Salinicola rhizosphaerae]|uniref:Recombinase family protein n=1 Tax=Salinicola rhizosphaerae TaxID=1443141 RepID=A0ABQ3DVD1_9GAMM|nr:recombinase family protein [Salinicola rhizosphaerae]GHB13071.1 hypothetical protein GCM10009038_08960 [Salinicola rhizosphaerae]